jgi:quinolinate synthase
VLSQAAFVGSTSALIERVVSSPKREFIVATEPGVIHQMERRAPGKHLIPAPGLGNCACNTCPHMRLNTLEKLYLCLRDLEPEIEVAPDIRERALRPIQRMLAFSAGDTGALLRD